RQRDREPDGESADDEGERYRPGPADALRDGLAVGVGAAEVAVSDEVPEEEVGRDVDATAATEILLAAKSVRALVTARFDAHARVDPDDLAEVAVTTERLHFFDLTTGRAIR